MRKISLCLILLAYLLCSKLPVSAQVGLFIRPNSSSLTAPVTGQTYLFNSTNNTINAYNGSAFFPISAPKNNFTATTNPTTSDDNTLGYTPGSQWYNTSNSNIYSLVDATTNAAIWVQTNNLGGLTIPLTQLAAGGASTGQSLLFNGTHWAPGSPAINLSQLLQSGASSGQVPVWNGSNWVPVSISSAGGAPSTLTYLTVGTESSNLPNSSQLQAGSGITLTPSTNVLTISASGGGGGAPVWPTVTLTSSSPTVTPSPGTCYFLNPFDSNVTITLPAPDGTNIGQTIMLIPQENCTATWTTGVNINGIDAAGFGNLTATAIIFLISDGSSSWWTISPID
jgi:hypothetical protein